MFLKGKYVRVSVIFPWGEGVTVNNLAHYKRFQEYIIADSEFDRAFCKQPGEALRQYGLGLEVEMLRPFWDKNFAKKIAEKKADNPLDSLNRELREAVSDKKLLSCLEPEASDNLNYRAWRRRQQERTKSQFQQQHDQKISHILYAFELAKGCSGNCPFCALDAPPLQKIYYHTEQNARLWREILQISKDIFGKAAIATACYWATEPFDNPDYEKFCIDFAEVHGCFPQTTTVKHLEDIERTRRFLKISEEYGGRKSHRFSIISLPMLRKLFQEFSPDELLPIQLVLNNKESRNLYSDSGRARKMAAQPKLKNKLLMSSTSACVTGFLVNMPDKTIELTTPCPATDELPYGYVVYEAASFATAAEFGEIIRTMIEKYMPLCSPPDKRLRFRPDLEFKALDDGFQVFTKFMTRTFKNDPILKELGEMISKGTYTLEKIEEMFEWYFLPTGYLADAMQKIFDAGVLDEPFR